MPQARLLNAFCPVLRFDAAEKYFPVSAESFISSALLLSKDVPPEQLLVHQNLQQQEQQQEQQPGGATTETPSPNLTLTRQESQNLEEIDEISGSVDTGGAERIPDTNERATSDTGAATLGQTCGRCGESQGWRIPGKQGWSVVVVPSASATTPRKTTATTTHCTEKGPWTSETLIQEQKRNGNDLKYRFRCFVCPPLFVYADF